MCLSHCGGPIHGDHWGKTIQSVSPNELSLKNRWLIDKAGREQLAKFSSEIFLH